MTNKFLKRKLEDKIGKFLVERVSYYLEVSAKFITFPDIIIQIVSVHLLTLVNSKNFMGKIQYF